MITPSKDFLDIFKDTPGALSVTESIAIRTIASQAPEGNYICLGSHKGKDSLAACVSLKKGFFYLVDPIYEDNEIMQSVMGNVGSVIEKYNKTPILVADYSYNVIDKYAPYTYVFLDSGSHGDGLPMQEVKLLEEKVIEGGIICFHDFGNQFREPKEAAEYLVNTGKYEWIHINWDEIINYVRDNNLEDGNNSWHIYADNPFPNFVGAVKRKQS